MVTDKYNVLSNATGKWEHQDASLVLFTLGFMGKQDSLVGERLLTHSVGL